jgi:hypothetical protein
VSDAHDDPFEDADPGDENNDPVVTEMATNAIRPVAEGGGGPLVRDATVPREESRRAVEDAGPLASRTRTGLRATADAGVGTARHHHNRGVERRCDRPAWRPLEQLLGSDALCAHFMWMYDIELDDGSVVNAYKHRWTRRYIHLADDGRTFFYAYDHGYETDCYWPTAPYLALAAAFEQWESCDPAAEEETALRSALRKALEEEEEEEEE